MGQEDKKRGRDSPKSTKHAGNGAKTGGFAAHLCFLHKALFIYSIESMDGRPGHVSLNGHCSLRTLLPKRNRRGDGAT